ncbi:dynein regulatory complex subunit 3 isoform X2 [Mugil cephalus]|nr:dynein regulatory complex subunit 3 isoform X2 [Mugil cephalus]XP_047427845.1 dynein regulatory complex subunit 3 isoform X2 [Mugil cephalus]
MSSDKSCKPYPVGTHCSEVLELHMEYTKIHKIDHLWEYTSLTRLDLNNNLIEKIEGLDHLINLTWLNLSFNGIERIEGLEALRRLEVLNLSNNKISVIENVDTLENLTHFIFANNLLSQLENVLYIRKLKKLFTVILSGNPVSKADDYTFFIAAYFPDLMFLDYRYIDKNTRKEAMVKYPHILEKMRLEESQKQQTTETHQSKEAELQLHKDAFVEFLNGPDLFKSMFKDDPEAETLRCAPGMDALLQTFEQQMVEACVQLFETGLAEHEKRKTLVDSFFDGQRKTVEHYQRKASQTLAAFDQQHSERIAELQQLSDPDLFKAKLKHCNDEVNQLCQSLMELEFQLVTLLEENIKNLDGSISDMVGSFSETVQETFARCRDLEDVYYQNVKEVANETLQKVAKSELDEAMSSDVVMLFADKDAVMDALATGHDNHVVKINDRETQLVTCVSTWKGTLFKGIQDKETERNRMCISDMNTYMDRLKEQLEEMS